MIVYSQTRDHHGGLELAEYLRSLIEARRTEITGEEYIEWDTAFIGLKLHMLDYTNRWREYIEFHDAVLRELPYYELQIPVEQAGEYEGYTVEVAENLYHVHFLYRYRHQYASMKDKWQRWCAGQEMGNRLRHQQDKLSEKDIKKRLDFIAMQLDHHMARLDRQRGSSEGR